MKTAIGLYAAIASLTATSAVALPPQNDEASAYRSVAQDVPDNSSGRMQKGSNRRPILAQADNVRGPDDPAWAAGRWAGAADCRSRSYTIRFVLPEKSAEMAPLLDYEFISQKTGERGRGSVRYVLSPSRNYRLDATQVVSGEQWHPFAQIIITADNDGMPRLRSSGCGQLAGLRNEAPRQAVQARSAGPATTPARPEQNAPQRSIANTAPLAAVQSPSASVASTVRSQRSEGIFGDWTGTLTCPRNPASSIALWFGRENELETSRTRRRSAASEGAPPRYAAVLTQFVTGGRTGRAARQEYVGELTSDPQVYRFARATLSYEVGIGDAVIRNFTLRMETDKKTLVGTIEGERCTDFRVTRTDPAGSPEAPAVPVPADGGTFQRAAMGRAKCDSLLEWIAPIAATSSTSDFYAGRLNGALPFMDDLFVPVFGKPVETVTRDRGREIYQAINECSRDPLLKQRFELLRNLASSLQNDRDALFIHQEARKSRLALGRLAAAREEARRASEPTEAIASLAAAKVTFQSTQFTITEKSKVQLAAAVDIQLSALAEKAVAEIERKLSALAPTDRLQQISQLRGFESSPSIFLLPDARNKLVLRIEPIEVMTAEMVFRSLRQRGAILPKSVIGLSDFDRIEARPLLAILSPQVKARHEAEWLSDRAALMTAALSGEWEQPASWERNIEGLTKGAAWIQSFRTRWTAYLREGPVGESVSRFFTDRSRRLASIADDLRRQAGPTPSRAKIEQILSLPEDKRNPIALEYELIAVGL